MALPLTGMCDSRVMPTKQGGIGCLGRVGVASSLLASTWDPNGVSTSRSVAFSFRGGFTHSLSPCRVEFPGASVPSGRHSRQEGAICMVLPTGNPVKEGQGKGAQGHPAWSARAIKSFSMAELEARKLKYPTTGTEALLMGMLTEGTSHAARFLRSNGVTLFGVRDQIIKLLGKADMYFFSPEHPPLTEQAQKALDWAIEEKTRRGGTDEITASFMLLGIWAQKGSAGQKVLDALGFDDKKAEELLASEREPVAS